MSDIILDDSHRDNHESWSEQRLVQAIVLLEDAYSFRSIGHKLSPTNILKLYRIYWSKWIQRLLILVVACQLLLIFIQYPSSLSRTSDLTKERIRLTLPCSIQIIIEFLCLIIFYTDGIIQIYLMGLKNARKKPWIISYIIVTTISMIDLIISASLGCKEKTINIRYLFRPFYMVVISREMKKVLNSLRKSFLQILSVTILLGIHIYFFSVIGMILFPPVKSKDSADERADEGSKYFPDFPDSLLNLIILLTTANNPDVTLPAYSKHRLYIIYFVIFLTIGLYCLMTLFTVIKMNTFKEFFTTSMQNSLFRRRLAVRACFDVLLKFEFTPLSSSTTDDTSTLLLTRRSTRSTVPMSIVTRLISGSNLPEKHKRELLRILTRNSEENGEVNWDMFSTAMLSLDMDLLREHVEYQKYSGIWAMMQRIGASKYLTWFGNVIGSINFVILVVEGGLRYDPNFLRIDVILSNFLFTFCIYYCLESILKLWSLRPKVFFIYLFNTFDATLAITLFILHIIHWSIYGTLSITTSEITRDEIGTASSIWAITRIINLFVIFRAIRSMPHFTHYGIIMGTISDGMKNLKAFIGILICLFYSYAVLGIWLFHGVIKAPTEPDVNVTCGSYQQSKYWANNFDDFFSTIVVLYDVMLVNNWGIFLTALREFHTRWSQLYLVSWWFMSNVYILALVLGFIVELFSLNVARFEENGYNQRGRRSLKNTYFVKTLFHLFKRSLKEPSDEEITHALVKYKRLYDNRQ